MNYLLGESLWLEPIGLIGRARGVVAFCEEHHAIHPLCGRRRPGARRSAAFTPSINDLAIRVGTVNGSGSQSANLVILRALYAMGIPCSGKNVFPSNIEGLPTWFHIRASAKGYVCHVLDPQVLVCMNEPTAKDDVWPAQARGHLHLPRRFRRRSDRGCERRPVLPGAVPEAGGEGVSAGQDRQGIPGQAPQGHQHGLRRGAGLRLQDRDGGGRGRHPARVPRAQGQGRRDQHQRGANGLRMGRGEPPRWTCRSRSSGWRRPATRS